MHYQESCLLEGFVDYPYNGKKLAGVFRIFKRSCANYRPAMKNAFGINHRKRLVGDAQNTT